MRPRLLLQVRQQLVADRAVGQRNFQALAGAGDRLNEVGPADDADELAVLDDRDALDGVLFSSSAAISCKGVPAAS